MDKLPYVLYGRVSSDDQRERVTIQTQISEIKPWAELHEIEIVAMYLDDGVSGTIPLDARRDGARMLSDFRAGRIKARGVICLNHKRIGRTALVIHQVVDQIERELQLSIIAIREPVPAEASPGARAMMRAIYAGVAQYDREDILANSKAGMERVAHAGGWLGGRTPFGYKLVPFIAADLSYKGKRLEVDEEQSAVLREMRALYVSKKSLRPVADYLNARGIPHPMGWHNPARNRPWYTATIHHLLANPIYTGKWTWRNKKRVKTARTAASQDEGIHISIPPIFTPEEFIETLRVMKTNKKFAPRNLRRFYLVRGIIKCGRCGASYLALFAGTNGRGSKGSEHPYYRCSSHIFHGKTPCGNRGVRADFVDDLVWQQCVKIIREPGSVLEEVRDGLLAVRQIQPVGAGDVARFTEELRRKAGERERAINLHIKGKISEADLDIQLTKLQEEVDRIERERAEVSERERFAVVIEERFSSVEKMLAGMAQGLKGMKKERKREIVLALIDSVRVLPPEGTEKRPTIQIRFSFRPQESVDCVESAMPNSVIRPMAFGLDESEEASAKRTSSPADEAS
ncbi:MAG: recombinase family protein [Pyrinomonadaceae bacterium]